MKVDTKVVSVFNLKEEKLQAFISELDFVLRFFNHCSHWIWAESEAGQTIERDDPKTKFTPQISF